MDELRTALDGALAAIPAGELTAAVEGLIARYRSPDAFSEVILERPVDVTAYAAYRMPATYAAARAALSQVARAVPTFDPHTLLDLGGGTGAASWAATDVFPGLNSVTVLDQVATALELGRRLGASRAALRRARWEVVRLAAAVLPSADLVTVSYVLGELPAPVRSALLAAAARAARAVLVVEPGTPAGYGRVLAAREQLRASGLRIVAPCPHEAPCPLQSPDWCHFAARVNRSTLHRRVKSATLGYEDEKFSYVCALSPPAREAVALSPPAREAVALSPPAREAVALSPPARGAERPARVLRHPSQRKGLVRLRLCTPDGAAVDEFVSKRQGERYRAARDVSWGDVWH